MLESLFSKQVAQPFLKKEFPLYKETHDDRLFKHITFFEDDIDVKMRITAVDSNYKALKQSSSATQRVIKTNLYVEDPTKEKFRIKAVLSQEDHGISESYWVTDKHVDPDYAMSHNQYRIRGISSRGFKSDWVYSEIKDFNNDLIVYNMLYDVLDLMLTVHDDQIDYLMDYIVSDTFIEVIQEMEPVFGTNLDNEETKAASIQELLTMLSSRNEIGPKETFASKLGEQFLIIANELKMSFKENFMSSPKEFSELVKSYRLIDQYQDNKTDFFQLLLETFLEDRLQDIVQKSDIEVLLQNAEEMGIYLNGRYEFNVKNELITSVYNASPDDRFVTSLNDAVQLISEPVIYEALAYSKDETLERMIRMALTEIYAPLAAIDKHLVEIETDLIDHHEQKVSSSIVEFMIEQEESVVRHMLVNDIVEAVIKGDLEVIDDYHSDIIDIMIKFMNDSRKALLIDYDFDETLSVLMSVGENFRKEYVKEFYDHREEQIISIHNKVHSTSLLKLNGVKESYMAYLSEAQRISSISPVREEVEDYKVNLLDSILHDLSWIERGFESVLSAAWKEDFDNETQKQNTLWSDSFKVAYRDELHTRFNNERSSVNTRYSLLTDEKFIQNQIMKQSHLKDGLVSLQSDTYYNLFKHHLRDPNKYPILASHRVDIDHNLMDYFQLDGNERIQYALGDLDDKWPIGKFKLGTNTLRGEG
jgi:hypothetical protein